jgi:hypothetical protein
VTSAHHRTERLGHADGTCQVEHHAGQLGVAQVDRVEPRVGQVRVAEDRRVHLRTGQIGTGEVGAAEIGALQVGLDRQRRQGQHRRVAAPVEGVRQGVDPAEVADPEPPYSTASELNGLPPVPAVRHPMR